MYSQKKEKLKVRYDKNTGIISMNEKEVFKFTEERSALLSTAKDYTLHNLDGKPLLVLVYNTYNDIHKISDSNPKGRVIYYEVIFFNETKSKCEVGYRTFKPMMAYLYNNNLIVDGDLNKEAVDIFVMKYENSFTDLKMSR